jgi:hypothetical protein
LAKNYPAPMLDHSSARERTLEMFSRVTRKSDA